MEYRVHHDDGDRFWAWKRNAETLAGCPVVLPAVVLRAPVYAYIYIGT